MRQDTATGLGIPRSAVARNRATKPPARRASALHMAYFSVRGGRIRRTGGATDERLRRGVLIVHRLGLIIGRELQIGDAQAIQLSSGARTLLVYTPGSHQLCGVLGERQRVWPLMQKAGLDLEEGGAPKVPLRDPANSPPLSGLQDVDGIIGGWIGVAAKSPWASTLPIHFQPNAVAITTTALRRLFQCASRIGLGATSVEVLFPRHRLVVAGFSRGCVAALATATANDRVLLGATRELARRAEASCWLQPRFHDPGNVFAGTSATRHARSSDTTSRDARFATATRS